MERVTPTEARAAGAPASLAWKTALVSAGMLLSRVAGLARQMLLSSLLGLGMEASAFGAALKKNYSRPMQSLLPQRVRLWDRAKRLNAADYGGSTVEYPSEVSRNEGINATYEGGPMPDAGTMTYRVGDFVMRNARACPICGPIRSSTMCGVFSLTVRARSGTPIHCNADGPGRPTRRRRGRSPGVNAAYNAPGADRKSTRLNSSH